MSHVTFMWNACTCVELAESDADDSSDEYSTAGSGEEEGAGVASEHLASLVTAERGMINICLTHVLPWYWGCVGLGLGPSSTSRCPPLCIYSSQ